MKKLFVFLMVVGLVMAASGTASVLAQTTYKLYATSQQPWIASDFYLLYKDLDGDQKFSPNELISFSGVTFNSVTYTQILQVPNSNFDSPYTDGPNPRIFDWYFNNPSRFNTTAYLAPEYWTYSQVPVGAVATPGKTVVTDAEGDLLLRNCDPPHPGIACSLFLGESWDLPGYFDIKSAQITQVGGERVDLSIQLYEPIPAAPEYGFVAYIWQFAGGCVKPQTGNRDSISVVWAYWQDSETWEWRAYWYVITDCDPRSIERGDPVPFNFTPDGVKVRVTLDELLTAIDPPPIGPGYLVWHAGVRRVPFIWPQGCTGSNCWNSTAVDYAPNVIEFLDCGVPPNPPCAQVGEDPATWVPR